MCICLCPCDEKKQNDNRYDTGCKLPIISVSVNRYYIPIFKYHSSNDSKSISTEKRKKNSIDMQTLLFMSRCSKPTRSKNTPNEKHSNRISNHSSHIISNKSAEKRSFRGVHGVQSVKNFRSTSKDVNKVSSPKETPSTASFENLKRNLKNSKISKANDDTVSEMNRILESKAKCSTGKIESLYSSNA